MRMPDASTRRCRDFRRAYDDTPQAFSPSYRLFRDFRRHLQSDSMPLL